MGNQTAQPISDIAPVMRLSTLRSADGSDRVSDFKLFTKAVEIDKAASASAADSRTRIKCIASSSIEDRHGDTITEACIRGMAKQAVGLTIFRNHSYDIPGDIFGFVESAKTRKMTAAEAKDKGLLPDHIATASRAEYAFLELGIVVDESNPLSVQTLASIENGITIGVSIGAIILDYDEKEGHENSWFPPLIINEVELLEASMVGIPANPLSWVEAATKAIAMRKGLVDHDSTRNDLYRAIDQKNAEPKEDSGAKDDDKAETVDPANVPAGEEMPNAEEEGADEVGEDTELASDKAVEPNAQFSSPAEIVEHYRVLARDEESDIELNEKELRVLLADDLHSYLNTRPDDEQVDSLLKAVMEDRPLEADTTKDAETDSSGEESGDADTDAQEAAGDSDPENAEGTDPEAKEKAQLEVQQLLEAGILTSLTDAVGLLQKTLARLIEAEARATAAETENEELKGQLRTADQNVLAAVDFVNKLMDLPLGRKATVQAEAKAFSQNLESVYGAEIMGLLRNGKGSS